MTLIELGVLVVWFGEVIVCVVVGGNRFGAAGVLMGAIAGVALPIVVVKGLAGLWRVMTGDRPDRPPCLHGVCGSGDYRFLEVNHDEGYRSARGELGYVHQCRCGERYGFLPRRVRGRRHFVHLDRQGRATAYMSHRWFGPWEEAVEADRALVESGPGRAQ